MTIQNRPDLPIGELLRQSMRHWTTGVAIATSKFENICHGMTVNSFGSISLEPPYVTVTMVNNARTHGLVSRSGIFAVTILSRSQQPLAELFAGRVPDHDDRMNGLEIFTLQTGAPLLAGGAAFVDCRVIHSYEMPHSTLFVGEVVAAQAAPQPEPPLVYFNRNFTSRG